MSQNTPSLHRASRWPLQICNANLNALELFLRSELATASSVEFESWCAPCRCRSAAWPKRPPRPPEPATKQAVCPRPTPTSAPPAKPQVSGLAAFKILDRQVWGPGWHRNGQSCLGRCGGCRRAGKARQQHPQNSSARQHVQSNTTGDNLRLDERPRLRIGSACSLSDK